MNVRCMGCMEEYDSGYDICPHCGYWAGTSTEEMYHLNPGTVLNGKYIVGKVLTGSDDSEITYIGWDDRLHRKVTVREYLPKECSMRIPGSKEITAYRGEWEEQLKKGVETFIAEARKLIRFQDLPVVVRVYDCFEENGTAYLVMEHLEGRTLEEWLGNGRQMSMEESLKLLQPLFEDLKRFHAQDCIHGDIAPNHIFITENGSIKLLDLGSARHVALA
ncbi:MAG: protein kinase [Clostridiales bacterium]|nr:protein kinase [Clostridiales bacterium]